MKPLSTGISDQFTTESIGARNVMLDGSNIGYWKDRIRAWDAGYRIAPVFMDVAWTRRCQAACDFCYAQAQASEGGGIITRQNMLDFLGDAAAIGVKAMNFISDGESTMVDYYAESVEVASNLGIKVGAGTNGINLNEATLNRILPHLTFLRVNFSAGEKKRYAEIMGVKQGVYDRVIENIRMAVKIVRDNNLPCLVNMNLVCDPKDADQLVPFSKLAKELGVHYGIIKQCAVDPDGFLHVDYKDYKAIEDTLIACEQMSDEQTTIVVKWEKLKDEGKRKYNKCFGPMFALQLSGNGLLAPCGPLFQEKYKAFHIGNITRTRFKELFHSDRYLEVMRYLGSNHFNPQHRCATSCMQHLTNDWLFRYKNGQVDFPTDAGPENVEFLA